MRVWTLRGRCTNELSRCKRANMAHVPVMGRMIAPWPAPSLQPLALSPEEPPRSTMDLMTLLRPQCGHHRAETSRHEVNLALIVVLSFCVCCPGNMAILEYCTHNARYSC